LTRLTAFFKKAFGEITLGRLALAILVLPLLFYVYREVTRDVLIIDPFNVPKHFGDAGLTGEVVANRIGDKLHQIEIATRTRMKKDNLTSLREEGSVPDVEIPGTKLGLKTLVDITRAVLGIYPKHISGDIVVPVDTPTKVGPPPVKKQATVTVYLTQGRSRSAGVSLDVPADDLELLVQSTAETALGQVNPYVLAVYRVRHREYEKAIEIAGRIIRDPSEDILHKSAACTLWGVVLYEQKKYDEAIAKYQRAIVLNPKLALPYYNWGNLLDDQKKYDEAIAKYQKAIELDPNDADAYNGWAIVLDDQNKYDEAIAKYQRVIELDPNDAGAYTNWGNVLYKQKKYDEAIAMYQKAIELDPNDAGTCTNWGSALAKQGKYGEAIAMYQRAIELDPNDAAAYTNRGNALMKQGRYDEANAEFKKAGEPSPSQ
jgi:tetratricopeptide (TPR) repeat protein